MDNAAHISAAAPPPSRTLEALDPPVPMLILERGLRIRWVSSTAVAELGVARDRLVGRTWYDLFPLARARRGEHEQLFDGQREALDVPLVPLARGCEVPRYFSLRLRPLRTPDGRVEAILGIGEDITARVLAEQALRDSERRLEVALWSSNTAFWTIDVATDCAQMSPQFYTLTGISRAEWEAVAHPWNSHMHPDDRPRARRVYEDYVSGRLDTYECEYRLRTPRGWLWLYDRGRAVERSANGLVSRIAGTSQEVNARKRLEHALSEASEREQRHLSHDLHDGLGQELAGIQYLLSAIAARLQLTAHPEAGNVDRVLGHVRRTIGSARTIAHGLAAAHVANEGLATALSTLTEDFAATYGLTVSFAGADWSAPELAGAAGLSIYRIVQEALSNARRHGEATRIDVALERQEGVLRLRIEDNGRGIPQPLPVTDGMGLKIMAYRAQGIGATFAVERRAQGGTQVVLAWPPLAAGTAL